jgi:hypothetical protein
MSIVIADFQKVEKKIEKKISSVSGQNMSKTVIFYVELPLVQAPSCTKKYSLSVLVIFVALLLQKPFSRHSWSSGVSLTNT